MIAPIYRLSRGRKSTQQGTEVKYVGVRFPLLLIPLERSSTVGYLGYINAGPETRGFNLSIFDGAPGQRGPQRSPIGSKGFQNIKNMNKRRK